MRFVTTQRLIDRFGPQAKTLLEAIAPLDILLNADYNIVKLHCDTIKDDICLVGGPDIVPFGVLPNPAADPDSMVQSDNPYACTKDPLFYVPDKSVSRLPLEATNNNIDYLQTVLNHQKAYQDKSTTNQGWVNVVAAQWKGISDFLHDFFKMDNQYPSPPLGFNQPPHEFTTSRHAYLNLHGSKETQYYYGQSGSTYPIAVAPTAGQFEGTMVFTEACYGGYIDGRNKEDSIPLTALYSGAVGVVCSTCVAYDPAAPPIEGADLLFQMFTNHSLAGETIGVSMMKAKQDFATELIKRNGTIDPSNKKTMIEFVVYGFSNICV